MIQLGDIQIALVTDGVMHVDAGGAFGLTPRPLYRPYFEPDAHNLIPMALHCLVVRAAGKTVVVDTGLGLKLTERQRRNWGVVRDSGNLIDWLARLGVRPESVDLVINTHLHADHAAGDTKFGVDQHDIVPACPIAVVVAQLREYRGAVQPKVLSAACSFPTNYQPLVESGLMRLL